MQLEEKLHENIYYYTDVIKDPQKIIDLIEKLDENEEVYKVIPKWNNWNSSSRDGNVFGKKKDFNLSNVQNLPPDLKADADLIIQEIFNADVSVNVHFIPVPATSFYKSMGYDLLNYPVTYDNFSREIFFSVRGVHWRN
jgi:dTDP-4-amino-4,6-dideoxygalactose transaminase